MTKSADLIRAFEDEDTLPLDLNKVKDWLLGKRYQDRIEFVPVDLDTGIIRGYLIRKRVRETGWLLEPEEVSYIYFDRSQGEEWINLVVAKELIHILDAARCSTRDEFDRLTRSLTLPNDVKHLMEVPAFAFADKTGSIPALALLVPKAARDALLPAYQERLITDETIAEMAMIPVQHVRTVMSPEWPDIYEAMLRYYEVVARGVEPAPVPSDLPKRRSRKAGG